MKHILHPDEWVEIPEGEFLAGISEEQRQFLKQRILERTGYAQQVKSDPAFASVVEKSYRGEELSDEETHLFSRTRAATLIYLLRISPPQRKVHLKRFCIARYRITSAQYGQLMFSERPVTEIPGALEESPEIPNLAGRRAAAINIEEALRLCERLGARLPTADEWEKAARGTDGRLYPWGNEWNPDAGYFSRERKPPLPESYTGHEVDAFPQGVSPYGVWGMLGGYPERVEVPPEPRLKSYEFRGKTITVGKKGTDNYDQNPDRAFLDYLPAWPGSGEPVTLRLVLDELPSPEVAGG